MIHSDLVDEFFRDEVDALEWLENREPDELPDELKGHEFMSDYDILAALKLTECAPNIASIHPDQFSCLMSPDDDGDMPDEIEAACNAFNAAVKDVVLSWHATRKPIDISAYKEGADMRAERNAARAELAALRERIATEIAALKPLAEKYEEPYSDTNATRLDYARVQMAIGAYDALLWVLGEETQEPSRALQMFADAPTAKSQALRQLFAKHEEILRDMPDWKLGSPVNRREDTEAFPAATLLPAGECGEPPPRVKAVDLYPDDGYETH